MLRLKVDGALFKELDYESRFLSFYSALWLCELALRGSTYSGIMSDFPSSSFGSYRLRDLRAEWMKPMIPYAYSYTSPMFNWHSTGICENFSTLISIYVLSVEKGLFDRYYKYLDLVCPGLAECRLWCLRLPLIAEIEWLLGLFALFPLFRLFFMVFF